MRPAAKIYLVSRNVSVRSSNATNNVNLIDYNGAATTNIGYFACEINSTAGTGTTFNGNGINAGGAIGAGHNVIGGVFSGNNSGLNTCTGANISGSATFSGNSSGLNTCTGANVSGSATFSGNNYGLNTCTGANVSGSATFSGNNYGLYTCTGANVSGSATFSGNNYGLDNCTGANVSGSATFSGNNYGLNNCTGANISGSATFSGNNYGLNACTGANVSGSATFSGNSYGLNNCTGAISGDVVCSLNGQDVFLSRGWLDKLRLTRLPLCYKSWRVSIPIYERRRVTDRCHGL